MAADEGDTLGEAESSEGTHNPERFEAAVRLEELSRSIPELREPAANLFKGVAGKPGFAAMVKGISFSTPKLEGIRGLADVTRISDMIKVEPFAQASAIGALFKGPQIAGPDLSALLAPSLRVAETWRSVVPKMDIVGAQMAATRAVLATVGVGDFVTGLHQHVLALSGYKVDNLFGPRLSILDPAVRALLRQVRERQPPNWAGGTEDLYELDRLGQVEGLPLSWVPRAEIVELVRAAPNRDRRLQVLLEHKNEVLDDCERVLTDIDDPTFVNQAPLALRVVAALRDGHVEAAMALAVTIVDTMLKAEYRGLRYKQMREAIQYELDNVRIADTRWRLAVAPCALFLAYYDPHTGLPRPNWLNRHRAVHDADTQHYTDVHSLVATMLVTSVMRGLQDRHELRDGTLG